MDLAVVLSIATRSGLPLPGAPGEAPGQRAQLLFAVAGLAAQPGDRLILDLTTPLTEVPLDVRGNAQHWLIRTAEAALERTESRWEELFETQDVWNDVYAERQRLALQGYMRPGAVSRRGVTMEVVMRKQHLRARSAYEKARDNWTRAFADGGDHFYAALQAEADRYVKATQTYLGYVGLYIQGFVGAFSLHIMALCSNPLLPGLFRHLESINSFHLPDPPLIPTPWRPSLNQELMALFCRDVYLTLPHPALDELNFRLEVILGSYLHPAYAPPPRSYVQLEGRDGGLYVHTHIEEVSTIARPQAVEWAYPALYPVAPFLETTVINDLFLFSLPGDLPIVSLTITVEYLDAPSPRPLLLMYRSPTGTEAPDLARSVPSVTTSSPPGLGESIQLLLRSTPFAPPQPRFVARGHFWYTDSAGNESNHAPWLVTAPGPTISNRNMGTVHPSPPAMTTTLVDDLFSLGHAGAAPLASLTMVLTHELNNLYLMTPQLHRSDSGVPDIELSHQLLVPFTVDTPLTGVRWQLRLIAVGVTAVANPVIFTGTWWVTDALGIDSPHTFWSITVT